MNGNSAGDEKPLPLENRGFANTANGAVQHTASVVAGSWNWSKRDPGKSPARRQPGRLGGDPSLLPSVYAALLAVDLNGGFLVPRFQPGLANFLRLNRCECSAELSTFEFPSTRNRDRLIPVWCHRSGSLPLAARLMRPVNSLPPCISVEETKSPLPTKACISAAVSGFLPGRMHRR